MTDQQFELLVAEIRLLRAAVERRSPVPTRAAAELLTALYRRAGARAFSAAELVDYCRAADAEDLARLIEQAVGGLSPRKLGRFLRKIEGEAIGGYVVRRRGEDRTGIVWAVQVCEFGNTRNSQAAVAR